MNELKKLGNDFCHVFQHINLNQSSSYHIHNISHINANSTDSILATYFEVIVHKPLMLVRMLAIYFSVFINSRTISPFVHDFLESDAYSHSAWFENARRDLDKFW